MYIYVCLSMKYMYSQEYDFQWIKCINVKYKNVYLGHRFCLSKCMYMFVPLCLLNNIFCYINYHN